MLVDAACDVVVLADALCGVVELAMETFSTPSFTPDLDVDASLSDDELGVDFETLSLILETNMRMRVFISIFFFTYYMMIRYLGCFMHVHDIA